MLRCILSGDRYSPLSRPDEDGAVLILGTQWHAGGLVKIKWRTESTA